MSPIIGKDYSVQKIQPILMDLIKDENSDVRLNVCQGMIKLAPVVGSDLLNSTFLTTLSNMTKDAQWRVRMAVFEFIGDMSKEFGKDIFQKHLESIFITYLTNTAASVRETGIKKANELADKFKADWVVSSFVPKVIESYNIDKQGYNYRMCALNSLACVIPYLSKDQVAQSIVPVLVKAMKDPIPNVRFCSAKIIRQYNNHFDGGVLSSQMVPALKEMVQDTDKDVQYYATVALNSL